MISFYQSLDSAKKDEEGRKTKERSKKRRVRVKNSQFGNLIQASSPTTPSSPNTLNNNNCTSTGKAVPGRLWINTLGVVSITISWSTEGS